MGATVTFVTTVIGAIVGGLIAGYFSSKATKDAHANQKSISQENEAQIIRSLMQALHDELETIFDNYQENMGNRLESLNDGQPLNFYYPLVSDFFAVYNGNTFLLGRIKDNDLRKSIIKTYTLGKGMVDSFRMNNELVQKFEHWDSVYAETQSKVHLERALAHHQGLIEYAKVLKLQHATLKQNVHATLRTLRKNGVLSEAD